MTSWPDIHARPSVPACRTEGRQSVARIAPTQAAHLAALEHYWQIYCASYHHYSVNVLTGNLRQ